MKRREFVGATFAASVGVSLSSKAHSKLSDARIEILADEPIGKIAPEIYGHFVEHLGGVVYDGIWVGENSKIPNINGIRKSIVDALQKINPSVIRWPGGCFADSYNWRDGTGPRNQRPRRTNFWNNAQEWPKNVTDGPWKYEPNQFGTDDFIRFCKLTGAQPYLAANVRSLPAKDFYEWVEYCNSPAGTTTLADQRAELGSRDSYNVKFWGVGNESWGCGGNFTPEEYAQEYRRYSEWVPGYGTKLAFIGSGPNGRDLSWTRRFFARLAERGGFDRMWGWAAHHYSWNVTGRNAGWYEGKGDALKYKDEEWFELLKEANLMESLITDNWTVMGEFDRQHKIKLVIDEWGTWFKPGSELHPSHLLGQQSTIRDAVLAGLTLDTFHRHADKVAMANIAQLVNCLQALFFAHEDKFTVTPTYHVFDMYKDHQGGESLRTIVSSNKLEYSINGKTSSIPGINGSASLKDKELTLTVTNPSLKQAYDTELLIRGANVKEIKATVLTASDIHAHNTFAEPQNVVPKESTMKHEGGLQFAFPPASVTKLKLILS